MKNIYCRNGGKANAESEGLKLDVEALPGVGYAIAFLSARFKRFLSAPLA